jgi:hypothetical protein
VGLDSDTLVVATLAKGQGGYGDGDNSNNNDDSCCCDLPTTFSCNPDILSIYDVPTPYCP